MKSIFSQLRLDDSQPTGSTSSGKGKGRVGDQEMSPALGQAWPGTNTPLGGLEDMSQMGMGGGSQQ